MIISVCVKIQEILSLVKYSYLVPDFNCWILVGPSFLYSPFWWLVIGRDRALRVKGEFLGWSSRFIPICDKARRLKCESRHDWQATEAVSPACCEVWGRLKVLSKVGKVALLERVMVSVVSGCYARTFCVFCLFLIKKRPSIFILDFHLLPFLLSQVLGSLLRKCS